MAMIECDDELLREIVNEGTESLEASLEHLRELERNPEQPGAVDAIFRAFHSTKGSLAMVGFNKVSKFAHGCESALSLVREKQRRLTPPRLSILVEAVDTLTELLNVISSSGSEQITPVHEGFLDRLTDAFMAPDAIETELDPEPDDPFAAAGLVQIPAAASLSSPSPHPLEEKSKGPGSFGQEPKAVSTPAALSAAPSPALPVASSLETAFQSGPASNSARQPPESPRARTAQEVLAEALSGPWETVSAPKVDSRAPAPPSAVAVPAAPSQDKTATVRTATAALGQPTPQVAMPVAAAPKRTDVSDPRALSAKGPSQEVQVAAPPPKAARAASADETGESGGTASATLRVDVSRVDQILSIAGELFHIDERLKHMLGSLSSARALGGETAQLRRINQDLDVMMERLYDELLDMRKLPVVQVSRALERIVRDTCRQQAKKVKLVVVGERLRLDRQIIEAIRDPLMHMVRNSIDHGIEFPAEREMVGKPAEATLEISVIEGEENVEVLVVDDGRGINLEAIREKAIGLGWTSEAESVHLSEEELLSFICRPGFSTAKQVTDLSGRGVGMDVVQSNVRKAGGVLNIRTKKGLGTTMEILLPKAALPVIDGMVVVVGGTQYLIPLRSVRQLVAWHDIKVVRHPGGRFLAAMDKTTLPTVTLDGARVGNGLIEGRTVDTGLVLEDREGRRCLLPVDEVLGRQKALVNPIEPDMEASPVMSGAFILGNGRIGFVISIERLVAASYAVKSEVKRTILTPGKSSRRKGAMATA